MPGPGALPRRGPSRRSWRLCASDRRSDFGQCVCRRGTSGGGLPRPGSGPLGSEIDVQLLDRDVGSARVATYVAKYATKEPAMHPGLLGRILSEADLKSRGLPPHLYNMVMTAWSLGAVPELGSLGLRRHAHHLGYSGHFLTKSRGYSTTFGALRVARAEWHQQRGDGPAEPQATTKRLKAVGRGWANTGEALFAATQARQRAEDKKEADLEWHTRSE